MKKWILLMTVLFSAAGAIWADEAKETSSDSAAATVAAAPTPRSTPEPFLWHFLANWGVDLPPPSAGDLTGVDLGLGVGYNVTPDLSLWLDWNERAYVPNLLTVVVGAPDFSMNDLALWARYEVGAKGGPRLFVFAGPGLAFNRVVTPTSAALPPSVTLNETDFMAEWGLGLKFPLFLGVNLLFQWKESYDFLSPSFAQLALAPDTATVNSYQMALEF